MQLLIWSLPVVTQPWATMPPPPTQRYLLPEMHQTSNIWADRCASLILRKGLLQLMVRIALLQVFFRGIKLRRSPLTRKRVACSYLMSNNIIRCMSVIFPTRAYTSTMIQAFYILKRIWHHRLTLSNQINFIPWRLKIISLIIWEIRQ